MINQISNNIDSISSGYQKPKQPAAPAVPEQVAKSPAPIRQTQLNEQEIETVKLAYDQPDGRNQKALASYQDIEKAQMREEISSTFGIDLYA
ncbi:hypothetical protein K6Y31_09035 [Motilimonas cestriensis]|uniref:Uncharacterized protein n=1 Tax=Motilimonas cestriensis TaxID=2742685 RepID=A0ABS8W7J9_9GAMM|nr:hypothetical protein [Motilimonas cestriensis]MCE2594959.1 hypothetical protein [Motilimonas cestriensis]